LIFYIPFPFLFSLWRVDSLKVVIDAIEQKWPNAKLELFSLFIMQSCWCYFQWMYSIGSSCMYEWTRQCTNHDTDVSIGRAIFEDHPSDSWVTAQLRSTRSKCSRHDQSL
jgi:hypothetical protein